MPLQDIMVNCVYCTYGCNVCILVSSLLEHSLSYRFCKYLCAYSSLLLVHLRYYKCHPRIHVVSMDTSGYHVLCHTF